MDRATFFAIMGAFPTGVAVVTAMDATHEPRGLTTNALCSVSAEPPLMLVCVDKNSNTLPALQHGESFVINRGAAGGGDLGIFFAKKEQDIFPHVSGPPPKNALLFLPADSIAHAECNVVQEIEAGDHFILI